VVFALADFLITLTNLPMGVAVISELVRLAVHFTRFSGGAGHVARMVLTDKDSAGSLAVAFLRKTASKSRFLPTARRCVETDVCWVFDFYHPRWHELRRRRVAFGARAAVDKSTGKAKHHAALHDKHVASQFAEPPPIGTVSPHSRLTELAARLSLLDFFRPAQTK
jgi:hypothetical protein